MNGRLMSNIFVEVANLKASSAGVIANIVWTHATVKNTVVIMPSPVAGTHYNATWGIPGAIMGSTSTSPRTTTLTNCYIVGNKNIVGWRTGDSYNKAVNDGVAGSYKTYDAVSNLTADTTKTLTPFLAKCLNAKNA